MFKLSKATRTLLIIAVATAGIAGATHAANASGYYVNKSATVQVSWWDRLNVRKWPAVYSKKVGAIGPDQSVWVQRCVVKYNSSDWCKISDGHTSGWVNSKYLELADIY